VLTNDTRAKDVPSLKAEFGHPDVMIVLTCLSYYYQGLSRAQLKQCFELLLKSDDPGALYSLWTGKNPNIPATLRQLSSVNTSDPGQVETLFRLFRSHHPVIDYFLQMVVFPRNAKEFPNKLSTSAWDLAQVKTNFTTGFSGTNDGRYLLPTSMVQYDPVQQLSTNAKVMGYLLRPENDCYVPYVTDMHSTATHLLNIVVNQKPDIRVLLDVGAQMLDLENRQVAETWLSLMPSAQAAIYFQEDDLYVITQDGTTEPLVSSWFKDQLDQCLAYLDDVHTRYVFLVVTPSR
jgi:hypothetical protein